MSQSEDYLDSLLNSISKAKSDADSTVAAKKAAQQEEIDRRGRIAPEDDFMSASGIDGFKSRPVEHRYLRKAFSESEFLKDFEAELEDGSADTFIEDFEREIDEEEALFAQTGEVSSAESAVAAFLGDVENAVSEATEAIDGQLPGQAISSDMVIPDAGPDEDAGVISQPDVTDLTNSDLDFSVETAFPNLDLSSEEDGNPSGDIAGMNTDGSGEANLFDPDLGIGAMNEFAPDAHDGEEPNLAEGSDVSVESLEGLEDLADIDDLLNADATGETLDESLQSFDAMAADAEHGAPAANAVEPQKGIKGILAKIKNVLFGPDDEEEAPVTVGGSSADGEDVFGTLASGEGGATDGAPAEDKKEKKEKAKKEKKEKPKKEKKEKPPKPPKEPKPKKEKPVDNSPVIPKKRILVFVVLAASVCVVVLMFTKLMGTSRTINLAADYYEQGNYMMAYEKLNTLDLEKEEQIELRSKARMLADLQQCYKTYEMFMDLKQYDQALNSLIIGMGRYNENAERAAALGVSSAYDSFGDSIRSQLAMQFGLSDEQALEIYHKKNRHYYTIAIRQILIDMGLPYDSNN